MTVKKITMRGCDRNGQVDTTYCDHVAIAAGCCEYSAPPWRGGQERAAPPRPDNRPSQPLVRGDAGGGSNRGGRATLIGGSLVGRRAGWNGVGTRGRQNGAVCADLRFLLILRGVRDAREKKVRPWFGRGSDGRRWVHVRISDVGMSVRQGLLGIFGILFWADTARYTG